MRLIYRKSPSRRRLSTCSRETMIPVATIFSEVDWQNRRYPDVPSEIKVCYSSDWSCLVDLKRPRPRKSGDFFATISLITLRLACTRLAVCCKDRTAITNLISYSSSRITDTQQLTNQRSQYTVLYTDDKWNLHDQSTICTCISFGDMIRHSFVSSITTIHLSARH